MDADALRAQLEPKVWAGRASVDEIRMLKAICSHQGDRDCRDRAARLIPKPRPSRLLIAARFLALSLALATR
ncbi:MAG: hypothetical protein V9G14_17780 [Cypionkella sp.]